VVAEQRGGRGDASAVARAGEHCGDDRGDAHVLEDAVIVPPRREPERRHHGPGVERVAGEHGGALLHLADDAGDLGDERLVAEADDGGLAGDRALGDGRIGGEDLERQLEELARGLAQFVAADLEARRDDRRGVAPGLSATHHIRRPPRFPLA
jgi:hypothetical protein